MSGSWINITSDSQPNNGWTCVATSYTGQYSIAGNNNDKHLWISTNYGGVWTISTGSSISDAWGAVAISQNGNIMTACERNGTTSGTQSIYLFNNGSWSNISLIGTNAPGNTAYNWVSIAISPDNTTLAVCGQPTIGGYPFIWIYNISANSWYKATTAFGTSITSNNLGYACIAFNNWMYTVYSNGSGGWIESTIDNTNSNINTYFPNNPGWTCISSSFDGKTWAVCADQNYIYVGTLTSNYWTFIRQTSPGLSRWNRIQTGPDNISIIACSGDNDNISGTIWIGAYDGSIYNWTQQKDANGNNLLGDWFSISRSLDSKTYTKFVTVTKSSVNAEDTGIWIFTSTYAADPMACFNENTKILTNKGYFLIQNLRKGDLIKTINHGYVRLNTIGFKEIYNPAKDDRIKDQLYICKQNEFPELFEDLIITGCHSILVDEFNCDNQKNKIIELLGELYVTDNKYRLPACIDEKTQIYFKKGIHKIYHIALEHNDYYMNYGIYANGLLVESCSKRYLNEYSNMTLIE